MIIYFGLGGRRITPEVLDVISTHTTLCDVQKIFEMPSHYLDDWAINLQETVLQQEVALLDRNSSYVITLEEGTLGLRYNASHNGLGVQEIISLRECILEAYAVYQADPLTAPVTDSWNNLKQNSCNCSMRGIYVGIGRPYQRALPSALGR